MKNLIKHWPIKISSKSLQSFFGFVCFSVLSIALIAKDNSGPDIKLVHLESKLRKRLSFKTAFSKPSLVLNESLAPLEHLTLKESTRTKYYFLQNSFCSVFSETQNNKKTDPTDNLNIIAQANAALPLENQSVQLNSEERFFLNTMYIHDDLKDLFDRSYTEIYMKLSDQNNKFLSVQCQFPSDSISSASSFSDFLAKGLGNNFKYSPSFLF